MCTALKIVTTSFSVGSGIGPETSAPVFLAVSTIFAARLIQKLRDHKPLSLILIFCNSLISFLLNFLYCFRYARTRGSLTSFLLPNCTRSATCSGGSQRVQWFCLRRTRLPCVSYIFHTEQKLSESLRPHLRGDNSQWKFSYSKVTSHLIALHKPL